MRKKQYAFSAVLLIVVFSVAFVLGQTSILKQSQITYSVNAEVSASMQTPLNLGSLSSPSDGSKTFPDSVVVQGFKTGYATLTFTLPQSNLTQLANDFSKFEVSIGNGGGEIAWLDLSHTSATYQLALPQTCSYHIIVTYSTKVGVNEANRSAYLQLTVTS